MLRRVRQSRRRWPPSGTAGAALGPPGRQAAPLAAERDGCTAGGVHLIARHVAGAVGRCMGRWRGAKCRSVTQMPAYCDHLYHCSAIFTVTVCFFKTWFTRAILVLSQATVDAISQLDIGPPILAEHIWPRMLARATNMQNYTAGTRAHDSCMALA